MQLRTELVRARTLLAQNHCIAPSNRFCVAVAVVRKGKKPTADEVELASRGSVDNPLSGAPDAPGGGMNATLNERDSAKSAVV